MRFWGNYILGPSSSDEPKALDRRNFVLAQVTKSRVIRAGPTLGVGSYGQHACQQMAVRFAPAQTALRRVTCIRRMNSWSNLGSPAGEKRHGTNICYFASICWCLGDPKSRPFLPAGLKCRLKICERLACICELCACKQPLCPPVTRATKIEYDCGYRRKIWNPSATPTVHGQTEKMTGTANPICILGAEIKGVSWTARCHQNRSLRQKHNTVDWP